jgi:hypothetical protein
MIIEHIATETSIRPFFTTPFEEYSVVEGFMLLFFIIAVIGILFHFVRRYL